MPGQDVTGLPAFLESIQSLDGEQEQSVAEIEAKIAAMEEQEKLFDGNRESLLNDIQNQLRQELEKAGLVPKGEKDE